MLVLKKKDINMTEVKEKKVLFDPGFAQHTTILSISLPYLYDSIEKYKNFSQKKIKFKMLYPQILRMVENNVGFCLGSLLWAVYIKGAEQNSEIAGNPCFGDTYDKNETIEEINYSIEFFNQLKKDSKYYLGKDYEINPQHIKILEIYKDFLVENMNFVNTKTVSDLKLPQGINVPPENDLEKIHTKIQEVISSGKLLDLTEVFSLICRD